MSIWSSRFTLMEDEKLSDGHGAPYLGYDDPGTQFNTDGSPESLARLPRGGFLDIADARSGAPGLYRVLVQDGTTGVYADVYVSAAQLTAMRDVLSALIELQGEP